MLCCAIAADVALRASSIAEGNRVEALGERGGLDALAAIRVVTLRHGRHHDALLLGCVPSPAVAQAEQISIAAFGDTAISAESTGAVVNPANERQVGGHRCLHLEAEIVQQLGVVLAECFLVKADVGVVADAFNDAEAQPRLNPDTRSDSKANLVDPT